MSNSISAPISISRIEIYEMTIPLKSPFVISLGPITHAENTIIRIHTHSGIFGTGECSPFPTIHGETQAGNQAVAKALAALWIGKNPLAIEDRMDELERAIAFNACIKSAFDMALYDLKAKYCRMPLYQLLGGSKTKVMETDMTVGLGDPNQMAKEAQTFIEEGFTNIKIKLGGTTAEDVARIKAIRDAIGKEIPLRIDANQAWSVDTAIHTLHALKDFDIEHCEAPIPRWNAHQLPQVRANSPIPIMADEALFDQHDAVRLIQWNAVDYFNIKLSKSGGIRNAIRIAAIAQAAGIHCQVGCFSETRLGISALAHFSLAYANIIHFDMDSPLMLAEDPVVDGISYSQGGKIDISDRPGIGAEIDANYLNHLPKQLIQ
ncbi:MAG: dipeptide epimerase [Saprospiraceae bacterium]|nr:dipeptide epimerase [Saprospiraceae bacterium]